MKFRTNYRIPSLYKHVLHCILFFFVITLIYSMTESYKPDDSQQKPFDPFATYGYLTVIVVYTVRMIILLGFPQSLFNFLGLVLYDAFQDRVQFKGSILQAPFICFRVVTKGDYPHLVETNVKRNLKMCQALGLEKFRIEIVTDKAIRLPPNSYIKELIVPPSYTTKSGALFKAKALQYCLEDEINVLNDKDWIVHLDEETLLTENSIKGILNFVTDGRFDFGQGLITYGNEKVINWFTTLADNIRVSDDMGKLRFQFYMFHRPILSWKGSYVVSQAGAEKNVSFENGPDGSIAEDCYFCLKASSMGYRFNFIEGEMWEKSPFSVIDFLKQRKRWIQGISLVIHSSDIPFGSKYILALTLYAWFTAPLTILNIYTCAVYPLPIWSAINFLCCFIGAVNVYMFIFGLFKTYNIHTLGICRYIFLFCINICLIPLYSILECSAVIWGIFSKGRRFYVVNKHIDHPLLATNASRVVHSCE